MPHRALPIRTVGAAAALTLAAGALAGAVVLAPATASPAGATELPTTGLDILLTNDDGWNAPGITAVHDALEAAGHNVTLAAPATNQSGVSARVDFAGTLTAIEQTPGTWSVSTSPAGSVLFALDRLFPGDKPDLVVSGTNVGSNTGFDTNFSGTVGAATVASGMFDIPSVAISTATSGGTGAYARTADLLVDMLDAGLPRLPRGHVLNVNYPTLDAARPDPLGIRYTENSQASAAAFTYLPLPDANQYKIQGARGTEQPLPGTDTAVLGEGYVTFGVLDADRSVAAADAPAVTALIHELSGTTPPTPTVAPTSTATATPTPTPPVTATPTPGPAPRGWVQKLPKRVLAGSRQWVRVRHLGEADSVQITWQRVQKPRRSGAEAGRVAGDVAALKAPRQTGRYRVTVRLDGKTLRTGVVRVL